MAPWMYKQAPWNDLQSHVNEAASKNNQLSMPTKKQTRIGKLIYWLHNCMLLDIHCSLARIQIG